MGNCNEALGKRNLPRPLRGAETSNFSQTIQKEACLFFFPQTGTRRSKVNKRVKEI